MKTTDKFSENQQGALNGVRVVDLSSVFLGPVCSHMLAEMGADVIKVESLEGDSTRYIGPSRNRGMGPLFLQVNRNKRSIALDLKSEEGAAVLCRLLETADVFLSNIRLPALTRLGLSPDSLSSKHEKLVICHAVGFASGGPYANEPAFDDSIQGLSGLAALQGIAAERPQYMATVLADKVTGMMAAFSIVAALHSRSMTGKGQAIEIPMFETMVAFTLTEHMYGRVFDPPLGEGVYPRVASKFRRPYQTMNGYIAVLPYLDAQWKRFFSLIGAPELSDDARFCSMAARTQNVDALYELLDKEMLSNTSESWLKLLGSADIPAMPIKSVEDLFSDEHLLKTQFFKSIEHPSEGAILSMESPIGMRGTPAVKNYPAPNLGEHTSEVLLEIGYSDEEIGSMLRINAVRQFVSAE